MIKPSLYHRFFGALLLIGLLSISCNATPDSPKSDVIINEIVASNSSGITDEDGDHSDWIELYNRGTQPVNLAGWTLTNEVDQPAKWLFPDMTLAPGEFLVVFASGKNQQLLQPGRVLHTNFKLGKEGEFLGLYNLLEGRFMDEMSPQYPPQYRDTPYGRKEGTEGFVFLSSPTPGGPNDASQFWAGAVAPVEFSVPRGFYENALDISLSTSTSNAIIYYTTNGQRPTPETGTLYENPIAIESTTTLQAIAIHPAMLPSAIEAHSYIFMDDIVSQPADPQGFPANWGAQLALGQTASGIVPIVADYEMDPTVTASDGETQNLRNSLAAIPTLSLVMDGQSFTDLHRQTGDEYPVSLEWIDKTQPTANLMVNAGIAAHGDRIGPKQSFRLFFKNRYGPTKFNMPLYSDSVVSEFDTLLLLSAGQDSFAEPIENAEYGPTYLRDAWLNASQQAMSGEAIHQRPVHLYLNGLYWGIYYLAEQPDRAFMASYQGGLDEDWYVANVPHAIDNSSGAAYFSTLFALLNMPGSPQDRQQTLSQIAATIQPAHFSDFLILNWYSGNNILNQEQWFASFRQQDTINPQARFWIGRNNPIFQNQEIKLQLTVDNPVQPNLLQELFDTFSQNPDFKMTLADQMYKHLFHDGALTDAVTQSRWQKLGQPIAAAITAESARWGDAQGQPDPFTLDDWQSTYEQVLTGFTGRADALIAAARENGLYPHIDPPEFNLTGDLVESGFNLEMTLPDVCNTCVIYYTTNGSDPRLPVTGDVLPTAAAFQEPVVLSNSITLMARTYDTSAGEPWSALHQVTVNVLAQNTSLRITEIMYNPVGGDEYEFVELKNVGSSLIDLAGLTLEESIRFTFPSQTDPLGPNDFIVLVSNPDIFAQQYPNVTIGGVYEGHLSNKGESIILRDAEGQILLDIAYNDENYWPITPDGRGDSLTLRNPAGNPNNPKNWQASSILYGSPGKDDPAY